MNKSDLGQKLEREAVNKPAANDKPKRLSRRETQEQTHSRLLAAAIEIIANGGVAAASIRGICEAAGYSQGAFYSNFSSFSDLLLEVMENYIHAEAVKLREIIAKSQQGTLQQELAVLTNHLNKLAAQPQWSLLSLELQLYAQRDKEFSARYDECKKSFIGGYELLIKELIIRHNLTPRLEPTQIAIGLYSLWSGLAVCGTIQEAMPREEMLSAFFLAIVNEK